MQFHALGASAVRARTACAVVGIHEQGELTGAAVAIDERARGAITRIVKRGDFRAKLGEVLALHDLPGCPAERVLLVGLGSRKTFGRKAYRKAVAAATQWLAASGAADAVSFLAQDPVPEVDAYYAARYLVETAS